MTQSNGADTTSVARCCVTPSNSADGTRARTIQSRRFRVPGSRFRVRVPVRGSGSGSDASYATHATHATHVRARGDERGGSPEPNRPAADLKTPRGGRFDDEISEQSEQASCVARGVQKVRVFGFRIVRSRKPLLQERGRGRQREERQTDADGQCPQQPPPWTGAAAALRSRSASAAWLPPRSARRCAAAAATVAAHMCSTHVRRDIRAAARPERRPCTCSRPPGCRRAPEAASCLRAAAP